MRLWTSARSCILLAGMLLGLLVPLGTGQAAQSCSWLCVCSVATDALDFAGGSPFDFSSRQATTVVTVTCSLIFDPSGNYDFEVDITLALDAGMSGNPTARRMGRNEERLDYALFRDAARTKPWGDGSAGTYVLEDVLRISRPQTRVSKSYTIYGRLPGGQNRHVGGYADTVTVVLHH